MSFEFKDKLLEGVDEVVSDVKDESSKRVLVKLADKMGQNLQSIFADAVGRTVQDELARRGLAAKPLRKIDRISNRFAQAFRSNGYVSDEPGLRVSVQDMIDADKQLKKDMTDGKLAREDYVTHDGAFMWDHPMLMPRVISAVVREPAEPLLKLTELFQKIRLENPMTVMRFPAVSALAHGNLDMGEGDRVVEGSLEFAATIVATLGKCGIKVRFTEEMLKWSLFDVMAMHLRAAGRALALWKEQKCADAITNNGVTTFDNGSGNPLLYTTGRGSDMLFNGTLSMQDLHTSMASAFNSGFQPKVIGINPMGWSIFAQDPVMRNWAYAQGGANRIWQMIKGEVAAIKSWRKGLDGNITVDDPSQVATTYTEIPDLFPYPLRILVSPYFPYDPTEGTVDIALIDTSELGVMSVAQEPTSSEWDDPERDIHQVKIIERYAVNVLNEGQAIRWLKKVYLKRSYDVEDKVQLQLTGPLPTGTDGFDL